jgi:hypothetical protein
MEKQTANILASRYYLCNELPKTYNELSDDELDLYLEANAWQPFEGCLASVLWELIEDLASEFVRVSNT